MLKCKIDDDKLNFKSVGLCHHGFFATCSFVLKSILRFAKEHNKLPAQLNGVRLFSVYKTNYCDNEDIMKECFEQKLMSSNLQIKNDEKQSNTHVFDHTSHKSCFHKFELAELKRYVDLYFTPTVTIKSIISNIEKKYLIDYQNICTVYYRGTDKHKETGLATYTEFFKKAEELLQKNPNLRFFLQTDELEFATAFSQRFINNFYIDELRMVSRDVGVGPHFSLPRADRKAHAFWFLAVIIIMSRTKHIITSSCNGSLWAVLYRGNTENVHQYLKDHPNKKPKQYFGWVKHK